MAVGEMERQPEIGELRRYQQGEENPYIKRDKSEIHIQESEAPISSIPELQEKLQIRARDAYSLAINSRDCGSHK